MLVAFKSHFLHVSFLVDCFVALLVVQLPKEISPPPSPSADFSPQLHRKIRGWGRRELLL